MNKISICIDISEMEKAIQFYTIHNDPSIQKILDLTAPFATGVR